jgi:uncharacterized protein YecT (DUF1311 family)
MSDEPEPTAGTGEYVILPQRSFFGRRFVATVAIAAAVVTAAFIILRGNGTDAATIVAATDSSGLASGELALKGKTDSAPATASDSPSHKTPAPPASPTSTATPANSPAPAATSKSATRAASTARPLNSTVTDVTKTGGASDLCSSPDNADQRACLRSSLAQGDNDVNDKYKSVIAALRKQANVSDDSPDPASVERVRASQRNWLEYRDETCHLVGAMTVRFARPRAACYNGQSTKRLQELQSMLDSLRQPTTRPF